MWKLDLGELGAAAQNGGLLAEAIPEGTVLYRRARLISLFWRGSEQPQEENTMKRWRTILNTFVLCFCAAAAFGQDTPVPQPVPANVPIAAAPRALSVENTALSDLLADTCGNAVLAKDMPQLVAYPGLDQIKGMTLRALSAFPEGEMDDRKLASIQSDLNACVKQ